MGRLVLDTSVLIALNDSTDAHHESVSSKIASHRGQFFISAVTLAEVLVVPYQFGFQIGQSHALDISNQVDGVLEVDSEIAQRAAQIRAQSAISMIDALIIATAITAKATLWTCDAKQARGYEGAVLIV